MINHFSCRLFRSDTSVEPNLLAHTDTIGMLNDIFRINKEGCIQNDNDNNAFDIGDPVIGEYIEFDDEPDFSDALNRGEHIKDARYRSLVEQAERELFARFKFSKFSLLFHLFHLKSMHRWSIMPFDMLCKLLSTMFLKLIHFRHRGANVSS